MITAMDDRCYGYLDEPPTRPPSPPPRPLAVRHDRRRWIALAVVCLAMLMNTLDGSVVNVALPKIQDDLNFSQSNLSWVVNAYLIMFGSFLLLAGRLGDLVGRKRVFLSGVALFTLASAVCGLADDQLLLVVARAVQGLGGAVSSSVIIALIITEFPDPIERARAMSAYIFVAVGGGSVGLLVGGVLTQTVNWHWIFFINIPIGLLTLVLGARLLEENAGIGLGGGIDWLGSILVTASLMVGIYAIVKATEYGWASAHTLGVGGVAVLMLVGVRRARVAHLEPDPAAGGAAHPGAARHVRRARARLVGHVGDVLPRRALPRADPRLRRARHRPRVPADDGRRRRDVGRRDRAPAGALRRAADRAPRPRRLHRGPRCCSRPSASTRPTSRASSSRSSCSASARAPRSSRCSRSRWRRCRASTPASRRAS